MNLLRLTIVTLAIAMLTAFTPLPAPPDGHLIIIGGGLRDDNVEIGNRIVALAGGNGAKIAVIPAAASDPEISGKAAVALLDKYGADAFVVPVSVHLKNTDYVTEVNRIANVEMVSAAAGVYFVGGNQNLITKVLRTPEGVNTPLLNAIWGVYRKGGVIAGTSAGAAIMSESMFGNPPTVMNTMKLDVEDKQEIVPGLGFVGPELFIDQHAIIRGRFARMIPLMIKKHYEIGLGVAENTAMVIDKNHNVEIIGYKGAIFIDLKDVRVNSQIAEFNASNVKISFLDRGERFNWGCQDFCV
jgi:cyanophycinase